MSKNNHKLYDYIHKRAKIINTLLICITASASYIFTLYGHYVLGLLFLNLTVVQFNHHTNLIGYIIESIMQVHHQHKKY